MVRILLVESESATAERMRESLALHPGWEVVRVGTLLEAIRAAGDARFDAAVLDYDLPDGTGLDILDFLRIGSPGIQILLVSDRTSEAIAFHALSHGAGDVLVKDKHLEQELAQRVGALLDRTSPEQALVETLGPLGAYEEAPPDPDEAIVRMPPLDQVLHDLVQGAVRAVALFDTRGRPVAWRLLPGADPEGLGFAVGTIHGQIGALWTYGEIRPTGYDILVEVEGGLLGLTAIPGTYVVACMFDPETPRNRALERLEVVARRIFNALRGQQTL